MRVPIKAAPAKPSRPPEARNEIDPSSDRNRSAATVSSKDFQQATLTASQSLSTHDSARSGGRNAPIGNPSPSLARGWMHTYGMPLSTFRSEADGLRAATFAHERSSNPLSAIFTNGTLGNRDISARNTVGNGLGGTGFLAMKPFPQAQDIQAAKSAVKVATGSTAPNDPFGKVVDEAEVEQSLEQLGTSVRDLQSLEQIAKNSSQDLASRSSPQGVMTRLSAVYDGWSTKRLIANQVFLALATTVPSTGHTDVDVGRVRSAEADFMNRLDRSFGGRGDGSYAAVPDAGRRAIEDGIEHFLSAEVR